MIRHLKSVFIAVLTWFALSGGLAADARIEAALQSFFPLQKIALTRAEVDIVTAEEILARGIFARWEGGLLNLRELHIRQESGLMNIRVEDLRITNSARSNLALSLSGDFTFTAIPRLAGRSDWLCRLAQITRGANIRQITAEWGASDDRRRQVRKEFLPHFTGAGIALEMNPDPVACRVNGTISSAGLALRDRSGTLAELDGLRLMGDFPLDLATARADPGNFRLNLDLQGLERTDNREIPQFGISSLNTSLTAPTSRSLGFVVLLRSLIDDFGAYTLERAFLEGWNALHLMRPEMRVNTQDMRLYLPGIIPTGMHANFRRAGITNAQASLSASLAFRGPRATLTGSLALTGVSDIDLEAEISTLAIPSQKIRDVLGGGGGGIWATELVALHRSKIAFNDAGLSQVSMDMFGIPPGRLVEEIQNLLAEGGYDNGFLQDFLGGIARALRMSQTSEVVKFFLDHQSPEGVRLPRDVDAWISGQSEPGATISTRFED